MQLAKNLLYNIKSKTTGLIAYRDINISKKMQRDFILNKSTNKVMYIQKNTIITDNLVSVFLLLHVKDMIVKINNNIKFIDAPNILPAIKKGVSGICTKADSFYLDKSNTSFITHLTVKFIVSVFTGYAIKNSKDIANKLRQFLLTENILVSSEKNVLAQHIITAVCANFKFPPEILEELTNYSIDYTFYKNNYVSAITIVEAVVLFYILNPWIIKNNLKVVAHNPDNFSSHNIEKFQEYCKSLGKQLNYDVSMESFRHKALPTIFGVENIQNKRWAYDIKLIKHPEKFLAMSKGYLSFSTEVSSLNVFIAILKRCLGDLKSQLKNKPSLNLIEKQCIMQYINYLEKLILDKNLSFENKQIEFELLRNSFDMDPQIKNLVFELFFSKYYAGLKQDINNVATTVILEDLIPKTGQKATVKVWLNFILKLIKVMPQEIREEMLENFQKFKQLEYDI